MSTPTLPHWAPSLFDLLIPEAQDAATLRACEVQLVEACARAWRPRLKGALTAYAAERGSDYAEAKHELVRVQVAASVGALLSGGVVVDRRRRSATVENPLLLLGGGVDPRRNRAARKFVVPRRWMRGPTLLWLDLTTLADLFLGDVLRGLDRELRTMKRERQQAVRFEDVERERQRIVGSRRASLVVLDDDDVIHAPAAEALSEAVAIARRNALIARSRIADWIGAGRRRGDRSARRRIVSRLSRGNRLTASDRRLLLRSRISLDEANGAG